MPARFAEIAESPHRNSDTRVPALSDKVCCDARAARLFNYGEERERERDGRKTRLNSAAVAGKFIVRFSPVGRDIIA